jgi:hypothetical protein
MSLYAQFLSIIIVTLEYGDGVGTDDALSVVMQVLSFIAAENKGTGTQYLQEATIYLPNK